VAKGKGGDRNSYTVLVLDDETTPEWHQKLAQAASSVRDLHLEKYEERMVLMMLGIIPTPEVGKKARQKDRYGRFYTNKD
jgi:hypothetical protein